MHFNSTYVNAIAEERHNDFLRRAEIARRNGTLPRRTVNPFTVAIQQLRTRIGKRRQSRPLTRAYT